MHGHFTIPTVYWKGDPKFSLNNWATTWGSSLVFYRLCEQRSLRPVFTARTHKVSSGDRKIPLDPITIDMLHADTTTGLYNVPKKVWPTVIPVLTLSLPNATVVEFTVHWQTRLQSKFKGTTDSCLFLTHIRDANFCVFLFQNVQGTKLYRIWKNTQFSVQEFNFKKYL